MSRSAERSNRRGFRPVLVHSADAAPPRQGGRVRGGLGRVLAAAERVVETELKLICDRDALAELAGSPHVGGDALEGGRHLDLTSTYYDTPGLALWGAGSALRVRSDGTQFVMTLKSRRRKAGSALERTERSARLNSMAPDIAALGRMLPAEIFEEVGAARLEPVFRTEVRRQARRLRTPLGAIEMAFDQGRIIAGEREEEISELELELVEGSPAALYHLARDLAARAPLSPSVVSKAARGYALAFGLAPPIPLAPRIRFAGKATLDDVLGVILRSSLDHLLESQAAAEDGRDPEGIHQFRVALRRLRSVLGLLQAIAPSQRLAGFREDAKWLMSNLDEARTWDVFVTQTVPTIAQACPAVDGFELIRAAAEGHRRRAHAVAAAAMTAPRTGRLQIELGLWLEQAGWRSGAAPDKLAVLAAPARSFAARVLGGLHRKVLQRGSRFAQLSVEERHRLRLALKRLRYVADFLLPLFGRRKGSRRYGKALARLQEHLGRYNDMAVTEGLVKRLLGDRLPAAGGRAGSAMLGWTAGRLDGSDPALLAAWAAFGRLVPPSARVS